MARSGGQQEAILEEFRHHVTLLVPSVIFLGAVTPRETRAVA